MKTNRDLKIESALLLIDEKASVPSVLPQKGFIRRTATASFSTQEIAQLNNKGIEAVQQKKYLLAKRIFRTTNNRQALAQLADRFDTQSDYLESAALHLELGNKVKLTQACQEIAQTVKLWLHEDD